MEILYCGHGIRPPGVFSIMKSEVLWETASVSEGMVATTQVIGQLLLNQENKMMEWYFLCKINIQQQRKRSNNTSSAIEKSFRSTYARGSGPSPYIANQKTIRDH